MVINKKIPSNIKTGPDICLHKGFFFDFRVSVDFFVLAANYHTNLLYFILKLMFRAQTESFVTVSAAAEIRIPPMRKAQICHIKDFNLSY